MRIKDRKKNIIIKRRETQKNGACSPDEGNPKFNIISRTDAHPKTHQSSSKMTFLGMKRRKKYIKKPSLLDGSAITSTSKHS